MSFSQLQDSIIEPGLCTHCGTCVGMCPVGCIEFGSDGKQEPQLVGDCIECNICTKVCPGKEVSFKELGKDVFGSFGSNFELGEFQELNLGHSLDDGIREGGASGGVVTDILVSLLEQGVIDGALVTGMKKDEPWVPEPVIARAKIEILECAQSKYVVSPTNICLKKLRENSGKFAVVALPCQVHGLRKAIELDNKLKERVHCIIGLYCGNILHPSAVDSWIKRSGIRKEDIQKFEFRGDDWPGNIKISSKKGAVFRINKFISNYVIPFHILGRCLYCIDMTNEFADLSVGDGWKYESEDRKGWSIIVIRSQRGSKIMGLVSDHLKIERITVDDALMMHSHGLDLKKNGAMIRIAHAHRKGKPVPEYGVEYVEPLRKRLIKERLFMIFIRVASTRVGRWLIDVVPLSVVGFAFVSLRKYWMKSTKKKSD